jgi:acetyl-CoA carboxylase carboxyltransferase component
MSDTARLSARTRIETLLDKNSFVEIGAFVTNRSTDFNLSQIKIPSDGVITGYGTISGKLVYVFSQDETVLGGSIGEMHAKKIVNLYDLALKTGAPVVGLLDCAGFRLEEATDALNGFGEIYLRQSMASGIIPQISAVFGMCGGGVAISTAFSDFIFMTKKKAKIFVNSPNTLEFNTVDKCDTSSSSFREDCGNVDILDDDEFSLLLKVRELVTIIPSNNTEGVTVEESTDDMNRALYNIQDSNSIDPNELIYEITDNQFFYEIKENYGKEMVIGFIKLNGKTIGVIANREVSNEGKLNSKLILEPVLTTNGCNKAERFVRFCDSFDIPILTLTNVCGYKADIEEEKTISAAVAKLTFAFANATIPKINLIIGKAYGSAYLTMNSKHIGADLVFSYPDAKIGMMDAKSAVNIIYNNENIENGDKIAFINQKANEYDQMQGSPLSAARRGYVDSIIDVDSTRKELIYAFDMLYSKKVTRPSKKHETV